MAEIISEAEFNAADARSLVDEIHSEHLVGEIEGFDAAARTAVRLAAEQVLAVTPATDTTSKQGKFRHALYEAYRLYRHNNHLIAARDKLVSAFEEYQGKPKEANYAQLGKNLGAAVDALEKDRLEKGKNP